MIYWYCQGDHNTQFFHSWANHRRKINSICSITDAQGRTLLDFVLAAFCWTKSLLCNVAAFTGMPFISESSDIQSVLLLYGKSLIMTSCKCHKLQEGYFSVQGRFCVDFNAEKLDPKLPSGGLSIMSGRSSVNNIRQDDENFPSGRPSVSRNFELFKIASVRT
jgi:hypothetical protein